MISFYQINDKAVKVYKLLMAASHNYYSKKIKMLIINRRIFYSNLLLFK